MLGNERLEIAVVPELGAKIISLRNLRTNREWMWHPAGALKLFRNRLRDEFSNGTLAGADECLPTIAPCVWRGRRLPDHGELWSSAWEVDVAAWENGLLKTHVSLPVSPFDFERTIRLEGNRVSMDYRLTNRGVSGEEFLWALHPLLRLEADDQLRLPASTRARLNGETWIDSPGVGLPVGGCAKTFASPVKEGQAELFNLRTRDRLFFEWNPQENGTLGLWLTRGGWHGHHHYAIEPTNGFPDPLDVAASQGSNEACV